MKVHFRLSDEVALVSRTLIAEIIEGSERQQHSQLDRCVRIIEWTRIEGQSEEHFIEINTEEIPELIRALQFMYSELKLYEDSL
jgi:hypothetical protein